MSEFSTYYTPEKEKTYDADEVDVVMSEVRDIIVDVENCFNVLYGVLSDYDLSREKHVERLEFMAPRIRRLLESALIRLQEEDKTDSDVESIRRQMKGVWVHEEFKNSAKEAEKDG